jgi:hypothetical protein
MLGRGGRTGKGPGIEGEMWQTMVSGRWLTMGGGGVH